MCREEEASRKVPRTKVRSRQLQYFSLKVGKGMGNIVTILPILRMMGRV
jgi:hypothetical protein